MWISKPIHMKCFLEIKWYFSCLRYEKLNGAVFQLVEMHLSCLSKSTTDKMGSSNSPGRENGYKSFSDKYFGTLKKRSFSFNLSTVNSNCIIHWMRVWKLKKPLNEKSRERLPGEKKTERIVTFLSHSKKIKAGHGITVLHAETKTKFLFNKKDRLLCCCFF